MDGEIRLIIDTDPGQDDAAAILMAHGLAKRGLIDFMALTAVAGNVGLNHTSANARIICDWAGRKDFPVYAGAGKPLLRDLVTAEEVHGKTGLDGVALHDPRMSVAKRSCRRLPDSTRFAARNAAHHALPHRTADQHRPGVQPRTGYCGRGEKYRIDGRLLL